MYDWGREWNQAPKGRARHPRREPAEKSHPIFIENGDSASSIILAEINADNSEPDLVEKVTPPLVGVSHAPPPTLIMHYNTSVIICCLYVHGLLYYVIRVASGHLLYFIHLLSMCPGSKAECFGFDGDKSDRANPRRSSWTKVTINRCSQVKKTGWYA